MSKMAQTQVNVGVASENGYPVKDTAVMGMGWYSNIPSIEVKSLAVDSSSAAVQSIS